MTKNTSDTKSLSVNTLTGPLQALTICTRLQSNFHEVLVNGLQMTLGESDDSDVILKDKRRSYWGIPEELDFELQHYYFQDNPSAISIKLIVFKSELPTIKDSYNPILPGPVGLIWQTENPDELNARLRDLGFLRVKGNPVVNRMYQGPEFLLLTSVEKMEKSFEFSEDMVLNSKGTGYTVYVSNRMEEEITFFTKVLGLEIKSDNDLQLTKGPYLEAETSKHYRSVVIGGIGEHFNHLILVDYADETATDTHVPPRIPNLGLVMWTFRTQDIGEILARAHANLIKIYRTPRKIKDPIYGEAIAMILLAPGGYLVEVYHQI